MLTLVMVAGTPGVRTVVVVVGHGQLEAVTVCPAVAV